MKKMLVVLVGLLFVLGIGQNVPASHPGSGTIGFDAVVPGGVQCTSSLTFVDMPGMVVSFPISGSPRRVLIRFDAEFHNFSPVQFNKRADIRVLIDGVDLGPNIVLFLTTFGESGTRGASFLSDVLPLGMHTALLQWHTSDGTVCVGYRILVVIGSF